MEEFFLGKQYQQSIERDSKKAYGKYYTPDYIIDFMLGKTIANADVVEKPFIKVLDPACGCGFFLIKAYDMLKEKFTTALPQLREKYCDKSYELYENGAMKVLEGIEYWKEENLHYHILKHCLYGADIDKKALGLCSASLLTKDGMTEYDENLNIIYCDSLIRWEKDYREEQLILELQQYKLIYGINNFKDNKIEYVDRIKAEEILKLNMFWSNKYDYIIGNPPYVGHKELALEYKEWLLDNYREVFKDKSDLSYCFYKRALEIIDDKGSIAFISSRYFMESPTGKSLRKYLQSKSKIVQIIDFCGEEIFKNVGIATSIFFLSPDAAEDNMIEVWKHNRNKINNIDSKGFEKFTINQSVLLEDRWILIPPWKRNVLDNIQSSCNKTLGEIVESFQGIITGCDKAFVMDEHMIKDLSIEEELLKPWIKNSHVDRYGIKESNLKLIYSNLIDDPSNYPNSIMHIEKYRKPLKNRRECKNGIRLWYQLQWGRIPELFMKDKIVYPYKSKNNRFALDTKGCFCSADVYSFTLKDSAKGYTLPFLLGVLNSGIYEFYFKLFAKNMGRGMFDYYPNTVMDLMIPDYEACKEIEPISIELIKLYEQNSSSINIEVMEAKIDTILADYFNLSTTGGIKLQ